MIVTRGLGTGPYPGSIVAFGLGGRSVLSIDIIDRDTGSYSLVAPTRLSTLTLTNVDATRVLEIVGGLSDSEVTVHYLDSNYQTADVGSSEIVIRASNEDILNTVKMEILRSQSEDQILKSSSSIAVSRNHEVSTATISSPSLEEDTSSSVSIHRIGSSKTESRSSEIQNK